MKDWMQTAHLYEWNYTRQILQLRIDEARGREKEEIGTDLFSETFLTETSTYWRLSRATAMCHPFYSLTR